jgi:TonB family protein
MKNIKVVSVFLFFLLLLNLTCAYYNTFYLAKQKFEEAEKSRQTSEEQGKEGYINKSLYDDVIKRASKVLTFYPKSRWVDDALFMIGMSFYWEKEYAKAQRKFEELMTNFPKSDYLPEARFYSGLSYYYLENRLDAIAIFKSITQTKEHKFKDQAYFSLGEIYFGEGDYLEAINNYQIITQQFKKSKNAIKSLFKIGEAYQKLEEFSKAQNSFEEIKNYKTDSKTIFDAWFKAGECAYLGGNYPEGLKIYSDLSQETKYFDKLPLLKLKLAEGYFALDSLDKAQKICEEITFQKPNTEESAKAYYQWGLIKEKQGNLTSAKAFFDSTAKERPGSLVARDALSKSANISKLEEYQKQLTSEPEDSLKKIDIFKTRFLLAEIYLWDMKLPDSALAEYQSIIQSDTTGENVPPALYAIGWIYENVKADTLKAKENYQKLLQDYPLSIYGQKAKEFLQVPAESLTLTPKLSYGQAEKVLFDQQNPDSAKTLLEKLVDDFKEGEYVIKAKFTLAWIKENYFNTGDSTIIEAYKEIVKDYPGTEYALAAQNKLGNIQNTEEPASPPQPVPSDTAFTDTTQTVPSPEETEAKIARAPTPKVRGTFVYPESERDSGIQGKVALKVKIDYFSGKVVEAEVVSSLKNDAIDEAAHKAALESVFSPDSLKMENLQGWYLYEIDVYPPTGQVP